MPYLVIIAFEQVDTSGGSVWHYRAYSSNDPSRSAAKLIRDVHQFISYQPTHPLPVPVTNYGFFRFEYTGRNNMTHEQRSQGILFAQTSDHDIDSEYTPVNRDDRSRLLEGGVDEDNIVGCEHFIVPETHFPQDDDTGDNGSTTSDSNSDTDED